MKDDARKYEILIENYIYKHPPQTQTISDLGRLGRILWRTRLELGQSFLYFNLLEL